MQTHPPPPPPPPPPPGPRRARAGAPPPPHTYRAHADAHAHASVQALCALTRWGALEGTEEKIVLTKILHHFRLSTADDDIPTLPGACAGRARPYISKGGQTETHRWACVTELILRPKGGVPLRLVRR
jgi:hypothetical protein